ncbi:MAG TPA: DUF3667 domain-containing protein [Flavitalea sp.]|nr:DUF3667 domain-containing protein [Flavitalea sp.]
MEPKESFWGLVAHFFYDITHFDGKFFTTLGYLLRKPGFLSKEYMRGRRASYLNPIRMYVFTSALFFLIFFSMFNIRNWDIGSDVTKRLERATSETSILKEQALQEAKTREDSIVIERLYARLGINPDSAGTNAPDSIRTKDSLEADKVMNEADRWTSRFAKYKSRAAYDSVQNAKPPGERDKWLPRTIKYRMIELNNKYEGKGNQFLKDLFDKFLHTFPYLLFVSLPLYALFLKFLYIRRRQFYFVDHGIFLVHLYIFTFIILLIFFGLYKLNEATRWGWIGWMQAALMMYGLIYTVMAMRNFYNQGWMKTIVKFILLNFLAFFSLMFLFTLFLILSVFRI